MLRERHCHDCHVLLVTTGEPGKEEGVLWAVWRGRGGGRGGGSVSALRMLPCRFPGSLGGHKPGFPHPPAGQDGSGSAQSEAAVPAVCSYRDRVWLLCLQYSPKAKGTADLSGRPGTFLQAMMGKGSPAAAQGINSSLPASCLYSQPGSTVK